MDPSTITPFINVGIAGACCVVLGVQYIAERARCNALQEKRVEDTKAMYEQEKRDRAESEAKYRSALDKSNQTLDSLTKLIERMIEKR